MVKKKLITAALVGTTLLAGFGLINVARRSIPQGETVVEVVDGDTFFPKVNLPAEAHAKAGQNKWKLVSKKDIQPDARNKYAFSICVYEKIK